MYQWIYNLYETHGIFAASLVWFLLIFVTLILGGLLVCVTLRINDR